MKTALKSAETPAMKLYTLAVSELQGVDGVPSKALVGFIGRLKDACPLFFELLDSEVIGSAAMRYLKARADEMAGKSAGGGQRWGESHVFTAPAKHSDTGGQPVPEHQVEGAAQDGGANGTGQAMNEGQRRRARSVSPRRDPKKLKESTSKLQKLGLMDTFKISERQGSMTSVGDVYMRSWSRIAKQKGKKHWVSGREYELARIMDAYAKSQAHIPDDAKTRDIVPEQVLKHAIEESTKVANYQLQITSIIEEVRDAS